MYMSFLLRIPLPVLNTMLNTATVPVQAPRESAVSAHTCTVLVPEYPIQADAARCGHVLDLVKYLEDDDGAAAGVAVDGVDGVACPLRGVGVRGVFVVSSWCLRGRLQGLWLARLSSSGISLPRRNTAKEVTTGGQSLPVRTAYQHRIPRC